MRPSDTQVLIVGGGAAMLAKKLATKPKPAASHGSGISGETIPIGTEMTVLMTTTLMLASWRPFFQ